jgi:para-aminobenzoate synthetase
MNQNVNEPFFYCQHLSTAQIVPVKFKSLGRVESHLNERYTVQWRHLYCRVEACVPAMRSMMRYAVIVLTLVNNVSDAWIVHHPFMNSYITFDRRKISTRFARNQMVLPTNALYKNANLDDVERLDLNLLLIDHYDSFTFNLVDILSQYCINPPTVVAADSAATWDELLCRQNCDHRNGRPFDGIILSPGPGRPDDKISALSRDCVRRNCDVPILGVCLGHQILGTVYGCNVVLAPEPVHGQVRGIRLLHDNAAVVDPLWTNIADSLNDKIQATRYHSLHVTELNGTNLIATAVSDDTDGVLMAMRHADYHHFGLQFHPESVGTNETGKMLLHNFVQLCWCRKQSSNSKANFHFQPVRKRESSTIQPSLSAPYSVYVHCVPSLPPNGANMRPVDVMNELLADEDYSFWLDDARAVNHLRPAVSILGASHRRVEYWGHDKDTDQQGVFVWDGNDAMVYKNCSMNMLTYLCEHHEKNTEEVTMVSFEKTDSYGLEEFAEKDLVGTLPFDFRGGHVGYLGYEVRHDTTRYQSNPRGCDAETDRSKHLTTKNNSSVPTAAFLWADKSFVYDHQTQEWYLVGVHSNVGGNNTFRKYDILNWMRSMSDRLRIGNGATTDHTSRICIDSVSDKMLTTPTFSPNRSRDCYNRNFAQCLDYIRNGESYELCLTNQLESRVPRSASTSPLKLYNILRRRNPAPFSAFLNWNPKERWKSSSPKLQQKSALAICCSSPERFVSVKRIRPDDGHVTGHADPAPKWEVQAKPIKGTIARVLPSSNRTTLTAEEQIEDLILAKKLHSSVKDRAENLMIVDLLRNDLSQVCTTGSVHVSKLMDIESYATVHQMVSTICGQLDSTKNVIDVLRACFPGGSMTGAPKVRTMELLHELEDHFCRGPYSGCLGYISLNGCMDMNIVIRTAVLTPDWWENLTSVENDDHNSRAFWNVSVGAGGAITALSQSNDEYDEMLLKASAVIGSVQEWAAAGMDHDAPSMKHNVTAAKSIFPVAIP